MKSKYAFSVMIHCPYIMVVQMHHSCWEIHIVVISCHLAKSLQATNYSFIFIRMDITLELDSNWNTMKQVRILQSIMCLELEKDKKIVKSTCYVHNLRNILKPCPLYESPHSG